MALVISENDYLHEFTVTAKLVHEFEKVLPVTFLTTGILLILNVLNTPFDRHQNAINLLKDESSDCLAFYRDQFTEELNSFDSVRNFFGIQLLLGFDEGFR